MPDYHIIRFLLGLTELTLACAVRRRDIGYLFCFRLYMLWSSLLHLIPAFPTSHLYQHWVQVPLFQLTLGAMFASTFELYRCLIPLTYRRERELLGALAICGGLIPLCVSGSWSAANWYQAFMLVRQDAMVGMTVGMALAWQWVSSRRPVKLGARIDQQGWLWVGWLWAAAMLASTAKGGWFWSLTEWRGGAWKWRVASDMLMAMQVGIGWGMWTNLRQWREQAGVAASQCAPSVPVGLRS